MIDLITTVSSFFYLCYSELELFSLHLQGFVGVVVHVNCGDQPQQHGLVSSVHNALLGFTRVRQSKPEPTNLNTMPATGSAQSVASVLLFVSVCACMSLFLGARIWLVCLYASTCENLLEQIMWCEERG